MTTIIPLLLLSLLSLSSATVTPSLSESLSSLGFHDLAASASTIPVPYQHFPITVFIPTQSSLSTCPTCSLSLLLQEHTLPGLFPLPYLLSLLPGTRIESLSPAHCLTVTHSDSNSPSLSKKVFVSGVELTHPSLLSTPSLIIHVISGFLTHISPQSCSLERMTSLSFLPSNHALPHGAFHSLSPHRDDFLMRLMLKDAVLRLKLSGYGVLSIAIRMRAAELAGLESFTVFTIDDMAVFSPGGHAYVSDFGMHIVPNKRILGGDLDRLSLGTVLRTMDVNNEVVVTGSGKVNYVKAIVPDLLFNTKIAIHGVKMPFPHVNVTAAVRALSRRSFDDVSRSYADVAVGSVGGGAGVGNPAAEIEDHHGL